VVSEYLFCVDTDSYAGNFERELCAYMTGITGECGVGHEAAKLYEEAGFKPLDDLVGQAQDDHGCWRPAAIQPTPGWFNDGVGNHYRESDYDESEVIKTHNENVENYAKNTIEKVYADKEYAKKEADRHRKEHTTKRVNKYPAYNSVGIVLTRKPTKEEVEFLKSRAHKFTTERGKKSRFSGEFGGIHNFEIEGFRLVKETTKQTSEEV
jgi:hypothetical protein